MAETRLSVCIYCSQCQTVRFLNYTLKCREAQQIYSHVTEFHNEGALMLKTFAYNASAIQGTDVTVRWMSLMCMLVNSCVMDEVR